MFLRARLLSKLQGKVLSTSGNPTAASRPDGTEGEGGHDQSSSVLASEGVPRARGASLLHGSRWTRRGRGPAPTRESSTPRAAQQPPPLRTSRQEKRLRNFPPAGRSKVRRPDPNLRPSSACFLGVLSRLGHVTPTRVPALGSPSFSQQLPARSEADREEGRLQHAAGDARGVQGRVHGVRGPHKSPPGGTSPLAPAASNSTNNRFYLSDYEAVKVTFYFYLNRRLSI